MKKDEDDLMIFKWDEVCRPVLFYDGECWLCNWAVRFVLQHERQPRFLFASLTGKTAQARLKEQYREANSLVLLDCEAPPEKRVQIRSRAVFRLCWLMGGVWRVPGLLQFLPAFLFDWAYNLIANNRYAIWGKAENCDLPPPELRERLLP